MAMIIDGVAGVTYTAKAIATPKTSSSSSSNDAQTTLNGSFLNVLRIAPLMITGGIVFGASTLF